MNGSLCTPAEAEIGLCWAIIQVPNTSSLIRAGIRINICAGDQD
jgi:hypothetical protein